MLSRRNLLALPFAPFVLRATDAFYLRGGDHVVFYGDSITDQRLYTTFVETFVVTRYPKMPVRFTHSGWGGDRVTGGGGGNLETRLQRDVFAHRPTVFTSMLGMNDGRYRAFDPAFFDEFLQGYNRLVSLVQARVPECRITLIRPSTYDDITRPPMFEGGYNAVLVRYGDALAKLAQERQCGIADLNGLLAKTLQGANAENATLAQRFLPDRVHPQPSGHLVMAQSLLDAWRAPSLVSRTVLDTNPRNVIVTENTNVTDLAVEDAVTWNQLDWALPMPVDPKDPALALAQKHSGFTARLNQHLLTVHGLAAGDWSLSIDRQPIARLGAAQLREGVNLADYETPMAKQARRVHDLTLKRTRIKNARWRELQVPLENEALDASAATMSQLDALALELERAQRLAAQPVEHVFKLEKAS
ncbi:MAG: SGNH/GDSL hydrolase family protein [Bryobacteraceae bacterium]|nr:SGNH/GDSL hydrolase family protein [Bryobacteraceae bacterium]